MRILIADDEALTRMGLKAMLHDMGHIVVGAAPDGRSALRLACELRPDVALLDIKMPGLDGLAVAQAIAEHCPLPVVVLTAYSDRDLVAQAAATETVQGYLVKPVREAHLGPALELACARFEEWMVLRHEAATRREALETRNLLDRARRLLMEREHLTEGEAFLQIQHTARRERLSMRQVCEEMLAQE
ncbi:MAG: response regulator [Anaerolineae bacterium]|nr:response regulator [Anaerolineae bacterium]